MNAYELLTKNISLYPIEFVERFGIQGPHWATETWEKRERSLCHDMVCVLLANSEPSKSLEEEIIENLKKRRRTISSSDDEERPEKRPREKSPVPSTSMDEVDHDSYFEEMGDILTLEDDDYELPDYEPPDFEKDNSELTKYRYIVLEGLINSAMFQNHYCTKWMCARPNNLFDIIDTKEELLIEVKTTVNPVQIRNRFEEENDHEKATLIIIDMNTIEILYDNKKLDAMPGESKALNFLLNRKTHMKTLNIEDDVTTEGELSEILIQSKKVWEYINIIKDTIKIETEKSEFGPIPLEAFDIEHITKEKLFNSLIDPLETVSEEVVTWKGKLTPPPICEPTELDEDTDLYAIEKFMSLNIEGATLISGKMDLVNSIENLYNIWKNRSGEEKQFGFLNLKLNSDREKLREDTMESLGIGEKKHTYKAKLENPKQEERKPLMRHQYDQWIENIITLMGNKHQYNTEDTLNCSPEKISKIPMYREIQEWILSFYKKVSERNVGMFMNYIQNFYSRLSGAYNTTIGNRSTHSFIAAIPIKCTLYKNNTISKRLITGIAFRGPHHCKSPTDKMTLIIIEKIDVRKLPKHFYKNPTIIRTLEGEYFLIRKTAIKKIDGIHLTFIDNALFMATNMIGDILLNHKNNTTERVFRTLLQTFLTNDRAVNFFVDRVIDSVLMAVIGNARDEGFLSVFRKLIMILINDKRGENCFTFTVEGLCDKINECILDNPFSMHLLMSLRFALCF